MDIKEINANFKKINGFDYNNDIVIDEVSEDLVVAHVDATEKSLNPWGIVHGGIIFGLADIATGVLCYANKQKGVTIDGNINYLKPCKEKVIAKATKIKVGKTIGAYKVDIYNEKNELAAIMTSNYFNMD